MGAEKRDHFLELNGVKTHVITWGDPFDCNGKDVILCITGNPGLPDFYTEFGSQLHRDTELSVCILGQAGHEEVADIHNCETKQNTHLFSLKGQIQHKLDFLEKIDKNSKLHIIAHSIGAWETVEMLNNKQEYVGRVSSINLLFPTLQKMADCENGQFLNGITRRFHFLIIFLVHLVYLLPQILQNFLINHYLKYNSLPLEYQPRIKKFLKPQVVDKVLFLAYDEMDNVKKLNINGLDKIKHLTNVIYSSRDGWVPLSYMEDLKMFMPQITLKEVDINHSFVLKSSVRVAKMVTDFIKLKL